MEARHCTLQPERTGRVRSSLNKAAIPRTRPDRNNGRCASTDFFRDIKSRATANRAIHTAVSRRNRAFDDNNILALLLQQRAATQTRLGQYIGSHDGFVVLPGEGLQNKVFHCGMHGPEHRLRIAGTVLELQPDQNWLPLLTQRVCDDLGIGRR